MPLAAMPLLSEGLPASASSQDASYVASWVNAAGRPDLEWRSLAGQAMPQWVALDLSGMTGTRTACLVHVKAGVGVNSEYQYDLVYANALPAGQWTSYTLETNTAAGGGAAPTTGWTVVATVSGTKLSNITHGPLNLTGVNWIRVNVSASGGTFTAAHISIYDASAGYDGFIVLGDSISETTWSADNNDTNRSIALRLNTATGTYYPEVANASNVGAGASNGLTIEATAFAASPVPYVVLGYGMNDSNTGSPTQLMTGAQVSAYQSNMQSLIDDAHAAGKIVILPNLTYPQDNANHQANVQTLNGTISTLWSNNSSVLHGPDLYTLTYNNPSLITAGDVHPTETGYITIRDQWATWLENNVYPAPPPGPRTVSTTGDANATRGGPDGQALFVTSTGTAAALYMDGNNVSLRTAASPWTYWSGETTLAGSAYGVWGWLDTATNNLLVAYTQYSGTAPTPRLFFLLLTWNGIDGWTAGSPVAVDATKAYTGVQAGARIFRDAAGTLWIVAMQNDGTQTDSPSFYSTDNGSTWTAGAVVPGIYYYGDTRATVVSGSTTVFIYAGSDGAFHGSKRLSTDPVGNAWTAITPSGNLGVDRTYQVLSAAVDGNGDVIVAMAAPGTFAIRTARYHVAGDTWSGSTDIGTGTSDAYVGLVAINGDVYAQWAEYAAANSYALVERTWDHSAQAWGAKQTLVAAGANRVWVAPGTDGSKLLALYTEGTASPYKVQFNATAAASVSGSGSARLLTLTASGTAGQADDVTGTPPLLALTATGTAQQTDRATGIVALFGLQSAAVVQQAQHASGMPVLFTLAGSARGTTTAADHATGAPVLFVLASAGSGRAAAVAVATPGRHTATDRPVHGSPATDGSTLRYPLGSVVVLEDEIVDDTGAPLEPDNLTLVITKPDGSVISKVLSDLTQLASNHYALDCVTTDSDPPGLWSYRFASTGNGEGADRHAFWVDP